MVHFSKKLRQPLNTVERIVKRLEQSLLNGPDLGYILDYFVTDEPSRNFLRYYFRVTGNQDRFLNSPTFFSSFISKYSIQGVTDEYLQFLEQEKSVILDLSNENHIDQIFEDYFESNANCIIKDVPYTHGVFYTKLIHTLKPEEFCALDSKIAENLKVNTMDWAVGLNDASCAYKLFSERHTEFISKTRDALKRRIEYHHASFKIDRFTNLKLLDMIMWYKSNKE